MFFSIRTQFLLYFGLIIGATNGSHKSIWLLQKASLVAQSTDGKIDLAVHPQLKEQCKNGHMANQTELLLLALTGNRESPKGSWLKHMVQLQRSIQMQNIPDYTLYPQVINMRQTVRAVLSGDPIDEAPINDPPVIPLRIPKYACQRELSKWPELVVLVHTCAACSADRMHARNTYMKQDLWSELNVNFVFVVMTPSNIEQKTDIPTDASNVETELFEESETFADLLIGGPTASEWIETWAQILAFRWSAVYCADQVPLFLFLNSSFSINPRNLIAFIRSIPRDLQTIMNVGLPPKSFNVPRNNEFNAVDEDVMPWNRYPEYYNTGAFFVGSELLEQAAVAMAFTQPFKQASIYLGLVWAKLGYPALKLPHIINETGNSTTMSSLAVVGTEVLDRVMDWGSGFLY